MGILAEALYGSLLLSGYDAFNTSTNDSCKYIILLDTVNILIIDTKRGTYSTTIPEHHLDRDIQKDSLAIIQNLMRKHHA